MPEWVEIVAGLLAVPTAFFGLWIYSRASDARETIANLRKDLKAEKDNAERIKKEMGADIEHYKKLLHEVIDIKNREAAINQGLTEELAALKAYHPEEIEEKLKKIREIRADAERQKSEEELRKFLLAQAAAQMLIPYNGILGGNPLPSCGCGSSIMWR